MGKDCAWSAKEDSIDELMKKITEHVSHEHGIQEIPYELKSKVELSIKDV